MNVSPPTGYCLAMKKILASASLAAVGAFSLNAANISMLSPLETAKPWSISAGLRGFYDDNYAMRPKSLARESFGFEVSPSAKLNIIKEQTRFTLGYDYIMRYFEDRTNDTSKPKLSRARLFGRIA